MPADSTLDELLERACLSIQYRLRWEVLDDAHWMMWFHRMELLSRLGVVQSLPTLARQIAVLREMLAAGQGCYAKVLSHAYFRKWGAYTGLMLERNWRDPLRRIYDLTFRSLIILHYVESWRLHSPLLNEERP
jgi:hypothetical protein